jgi:hypothetical protein
MRYQERQMKKKPVRKALKNRGVRFKPSRDFLDKAMAEYLAEGGKITRIEIEEKDYQDFVATPESPSTVDDFLSGRY